MINLQYWDIYIGTMKTAQNTSKDAVQYIDSLDKGTLSSNHLIEVFTETPSAQISVNIRLESIDI